MFGTPIPALSNLQNSINFNKGTTKFQDAQNVKECFANSINAAVTRYGSVTEVPQTEPVKIVESMPLNRGNRSRQFDGIITEITFQETTNKNHTQEESACGFSEDEGKAQSPQTLSEPIEEETSGQTSASLEDKPKIAVEPKDFDRDKTFRRPVTRELQALQTDLLKHAIFIQWWVSRVERSDFAAKIVKTPKAFVLGEIRNKPETAKDMFDSFQLEATSRVESFNSRLQSDFDFRQKYRHCESSITSEERDEIQSIAPYSLIALQREPKILAPVFAAEEIVSRSPMPPEIRAQVQEYFRQAAERKANQNRGSFRPTISDQKQKDYNEADHFGTPDPTSFERFWTRGEEQSLS